MCNTASNLHCTICNNGKAEGVAWGGRAGGAGGGGVCGGGRGVRRVQTGVAATQKGAIWCTGSMAQPAWTTLTNQEQIICRCQHELHTVAGSQHYLSCPETGHVQAASFRTCSNGRGQHLPAHEHLLWPTRLFIIQGIFILYLHHVLTMNVSSHHYIGCVH